MRSAIPPALVVIPARLDSVRLARKMLLRESGMTVLEHTYRAARTATLPARVVVATPDQEIADEVVAFGGEFVWTSSSAASGTDRVAEVARELAEYPLIINVQGDEPRIPGSYVDEVIKLLVDCPHHPVATLAAPMESAEDVASPTCVKVVMDRHQRALYFSRSPIPHVRDSATGIATGQPGRYWRHLGIYGYRREFLCELDTLPESILETSERLEQLRFLEAGVGISIRQVPRGTRGIDTAEDYAEFLRSLEITVA